MTQWINYQQDFTARRLMPFIVQNRDPKSGRIKIQGDIPGAYTPALITDVLKQRRADYFPGLPQGQETIDCVLDASQSYAVQYESFAPGPYTSSDGNGGDLVGITSDNCIQAFATMDGGHPGQLYYFKAHGNSDGWSEGCADAVLGGGWKSGVTDIYDPFGSGLWYPAYTRWFRGMLQVPLFVNGQLVSTPFLECILSEHYDALLPNTTKMERFINAWGFGKIRWEQWTVDGEQCDLNRVPSIAWAGPVNGGITSANWVITDCRHWLNLIDDDPNSTFTVSSTGWPPGPVQML